MTWRHLETFALGCLAVAGIGCTVRAALDELHRAAQGQPATTSLDDISESVVAIAQRHSVFGILLGWRTRPGGETDREVAVKRASALLVDAAVRRRGLDDPAVN